MHFFNDKHYGDCIYSLHFLNKICSCNDILCEFCYNQDYLGKYGLKQLQEFASDNQNIIFSDIKIDNSINLWVGNYNFTQAVKCERNPDYENWSKIQLILSQHICEAYNLHCPFSVLEDTILDEEILAKKITNQTFDYLIVNSYGCSGQIKYSSQQQDLLFLDIIKALNKKNKSFITTKKLLDYPSTADYNLSLVRIGQLSKNCKNILAIDTGPFHMCMNKFAINNYEKVILISNSNRSFELDNRFTISKDLNILHLLFD